MKHGELHSPISGHAVQLKQRIMQRCGIPVMQVHVRALGGGRGGASKKYLSEGARSCLSGSKMK